MEKAMRTIRTRPMFRKETTNSFYHSIKEKAADTILRQQKKANRITWRKTIFYPGLYACFYTLLLWKGDHLFLFYSCYALMGLLTTLIVFNVVHDAVHHSLFTGADANKRAALMLDILGGNSFVWSKRHVIYHHSFTNIPGWDIDIQQSQIVRFNDKQEYKKAYRYQYLYMPILYLFYSLNWILLRDFKDFFQRTSLIKQKTSIPVKEYVKLFLFKLFHFSYIILIPVLLLPHTALSFLLGFLIMHGLMSALTLLVLLPSHLDEDAQFPEPDENLMLADTWAVHQLKVTNDFGTNSSVLNFLMGGLNHHIAHHLFPNVNHNIIPGITQHITEVAREKELPYKCYSLKQVMVSHLKLLKKNGQLQHFLEE